MMTRRDTLLGAAIDALVMRGQMANAKGDRLKAMETFDTVLQFEGDRHHALRMLHALKHRFGGGAR